jgi:hypothetical protein
MFCAVVAIAVKDIGMNGKYPLNQTEVVLFYPSSA